MRHVIANGNRLLLSPRSLPRSCCSWSTAERRETVFRAENRRSIWSASFGLRSRSRGSSTQALRLEVGGFGTRAIYAQRKEDGSWAASFQMPPALDPGWHPVRLRFAAHWIQQRHFDCRRHSGRASRQDRLERRMRRKVMGSRPSQSGGRRVPEFPGERAAQNRSALDIRVLLV